MNNFIKNNEIKSLKKEPQEKTKFEWDDDFELDDIAWKEEERNRDFVLKKDTLANSIDREKLITQKIAEGLKADLLNIIASGHLQFRYESEALTSENLNVIKSWISSCNVAVRSQGKVHSDLFVKLGLDENFNLILQIVWELPLAKIQNRFLLWGTLQNLSKFLNSKNKLSDIVTVIFNKRDYSNSNLIGIYFSRKAKKEATKVNPNA